MIVVRKTPLLSLREDSIISVSECEEAEGKLLQVCTQEGIYRVPLKDVTSEFLAWAKGGEMAPTNSVNRSATHICHSSGRLYKFMRLPHNTGWHFWKDGAWWKSGIADIGDRLDPIDWEEVKL